MRFLILFFALLAPLQAQINTDSFLAAIAEVETAGDNSAVGHGGERSKYQFMRATWEQYSQIPFHKISDSKYLPEVERVARRHVEWIKFSLGQKGYTVNAYNCAAVWNLGLTGFIRQKKSEYAVRVENLYKLY